MKFIDYVTRYSKGEKFPDTPAFNAMKEAMVKMLGTSSPAIIAVSLQKAKRKGKKR
jgi:hypothetical protein